MRQVSQILEDLATYLATLPALKGADPYFADRMGELPRAICAWTNTRTSMKINGLLVTTHDIDIFIVVAPRASMTMAVRGMSDIAADVVTHLMKNITLTSTVTQFKVTGVRPATIGLGGETYVADVVSIDLEHKTVETIS